MTENKISFDQLPVAVGQVLQNHNVILQKIEALQSAVLTGSVDNLNPHLTRKETAKFFGISLNCLNDWSNKGIVTPYKVGQRTYFKRSELLQVMFNQPKRA